MDYPEKVKQLHEQAQAGHTSMTLSEMSKVNVPYPEHGDRWGKWEFDAKRLCLVFDDGRYEIDLEKITSSAPMLDWIFQVNMKAWASRKDVGDLIEAFDDLLRPQANLCSMGTDRQLDATKFLKEHIRTKKAAHRYGL